MQETSINIDSTSFIDWKSLLGNERAKPYFKELLQTIEKKRASGQSIYPPNNEVFNAFSKTSLQDLRVVILGQDPYHGAGQAHGLSFSVKPGVPKPPSLQNIFKELQDDLAIPIPSHGCLEHWATGGVLLLNSVLTVEKDNAGSHAGLGWETFTDCVIKEISSHCQGIVFLLWGSYAQKKGAVIDSTKHLVLTAPHPSPLSAHRGFLGCKHFSKTNEYLESIGKDPIDWEIT